MPAIALEPVDQVEVLTVMAADDHGDGGGVNNAAVINWSKSLSLLYAADGFW